jgi:hypothetical protein
MAVLGDLAFQNVTSANEDTGIGDSVGNAVTSGHNLSMFGFDVGGSVCTTAADVLLLGTSNATDCTTSGEINVIHIGAGAGDIIKSTGTGTPATSATTIAGTLNVASNLTVSGKLIFTGASPTITTGTATLDATASNQAGTVTEGTAQTGFTLTFNTANPFTTTPHCVVSSPNGSALSSYTPSTTTLVVANLTATGSIFTYACFQ